MWFRHHDTIRQQKNKNKKSAVKRDPISTHHFLERSARFIGVIVLWAPGAKSRSKKYRNVCSRKARREEISKIMANRAGKENTEVKVQNKHGKKTA